MADEATEAQPPEGKVESKVKTAKLRDGEVLKLRDQVTCSFPGRNYEGHVFEITEMNDWTYCESGVLIVAARKDGVQEHAKSLFGLKGIDANWFKKVQE